MDRPVRVKLAQERDWAAPQSPLWFCFEAAAYKLLAEWDVMKMAVDGGWSDGDPYFARAKVVDDALANFAMRAQTGGVDPSELAEFLVDTMEDRFNAEIDASMCASLAQVVVRIFEESRTGTTTGLRHILGDQGFEAAAAEKQPLALISVPVTADQRAAATEEGAAAGAEGASASSSSSAPVPAAQQAPSQDAMQDAEASAEAVEDDGWTTVPSKRRSNRVKNTYTVQGQLGAPSANPDQEEDTSMRDD